MKTITIYQTIDGKQFNTFNEAHQHEENLKLTSDVRDLLVRAINSTVDENGNKVFGEGSPSTASIYDTVNVLALLLVTTDLRTDLTTLLKV